MSRDDFQRHHPQPVGHSQTYLTSLVKELQERVTQLEQQSPRVITAPVTATDTIGNTFSVVMPSQVDGAASTLGGIQAPASFLPTVGDTVQLQVIGATPTYLPARVAVGQVGTTELSTSVNTSISTAQSTATNANTLAGTKNTVFRQPTQPTGVAVGDVWVDTVNGNQQYIWGPVGSVTRQNLTANPSFEFDTAGVVTSITGWTNYSNGSPGTLTRSVAGSGTGIALGTRCAKVVSASMPATSNTAMGYQQSYTAVPGDVFRVQAVLTVAVTDTNKLPEILVEWLNASNAVIGSTTASGSGTLTSQQTVVVNVNGGAALPALTASVRVSIRRRSNGSGSALTNADLMVDTVLVEKNRPTTALTTYFDGDTAAGTNDSKWDNPGSAPNSSSTYWADGSATGNQWYPMNLRSNALEPGSLVASNIIANGTISAALLQAVFVLANTMIAGDPVGNHSTLQQDGLHIYQVTQDGMSEVARLATGSNNFFAFTDATGNLVFNVDSTGYVSGSGANFTGDVIVQGLSLAGQLAAGTGSGNGQGAASGAQNWYGYNFGAGIGVVTTEVGLIEVPVWVDSSRMYLLIPDLSWNLSNTAGQLDLRIRDGGASSPTISSTLVYYRQFSSPVVGYDVTTSTPGLWQPSGSGINQHRLLLSASAGGSGNVNINGGTGGLNPPSIFVLDLGPAKPVNNTIVNRGGGGVGVPTQQYDTGWMSPTTILTYSGSGTLRNDTTDIVQGWDPSGINGDGYGVAGWSLPSITGSVDSVQVSLPWNWTYFNSGGTALLSPVHSGTMTPSSSFVANKMASNWSVNLSGKSGSVILTVPSSWWSLFSSSSSPRASFIGFGTSGGSNETFYVRFTAPNMRLRILYTQ